MLIVDSQVHAWEADQPNRPWDPTYGLKGGPAQMAREHHARNVMNVDAVLGAMDGQEVAAAVVVTPSIYGYDNSYSIEVARRHKERLAVVGRIDPESDVPHTIAEFEESGVVVGVRIVAMGGDGGTRLESGYWDHVLREVGRTALSVCVYPVDNLTALGTAARRFPDASLVVDHLALAQPPYQQLAADPWERLPELLELAEHAHVSVKLSGVPALSRAAFPFEDTWPHVERVIESFGVERVMWGSDFTRVAELHSYHDAVHYLEQVPSLGRPELAAVMGENARSILQFPPRQ